ncbi:MAG: hypothetical protein ACK5II_14365 [Paracoccus sp. (in: a-proteobacteria)]
MTQTYRKQITTRLMALLAMSVPASALAANDAVVVEDGNITAAVNAVTGGVARLVYLASPPMPLDTAIAPAAPLPGYPPRRPAIVLVPSCDWADEMQGTAQVQKAFSTSPVWLISSAPQESCDTTAIRASFDKAAAAPDHDRLAILLGDSLRLVAPPATEATVPEDRTGNRGSTGSSAPSAGSLLVISALPAGTGLDGKPSQLISAGEAPSEAAANTSGSDSTAATAVAAPVIAVGMTRRPGLPEPAVVVGELATLLAADKRKTTGVPYETRNRIHEIDPAFFSLLLQEGNFDPENGQYAAAIQAELSDMNCYAGGIDGNWGSGSLAALGRYFSTLGEVQKAASPGQELYHEIVLNKRVACPAVRVANPSRNNPPAASASAQSNNRSLGTASPGRGSRGGNPSTPTSTAARPTTQPAATTSSRPTINPSLINIGSGATR